MHRARQASTCWPPGRGPDRSALVLPLDRLKTADQYFSGMNRSIQLAGVRLIIDGVLAALLSDPNKRFVYVEARASIRTAHGRDQPCACGPAQLRRLPFILHARRWHSSPAGGANRATRPARSSASLSTRRGAARRKIFHAVSSRVGESHQLLFSCLHVRVSSQKRLQFANGGWVMHDEAAAHYADMIEQTARGHRFLEVRCLGQNGITAKVTACQGARLSCCISSPGRTPKKP